mgnify:CR=1 FL=1
MYDDLVEFLQESVTPFHAAATAESWLCAAGFTRLEEADYWNLEPGKGYYTTRNGSSVVAAAGASWPATATPRRGKSRPTPLKTTAAAA